MFGGKAINSGVSPGGNLGSVFIIDIWPSWATKTWGLLAVSGKTTIGVSKITSKLYKISSVLKY